MLKLIYYDCKKDYELIKAIKNHKCCGKDSGSSDDSSASSEITIDDVVKFIHDDIENDAPGLFPYTTLDDIPDYKDASGGQVCKTNNPYDKTFREVLLSTSSYIIGFKDGDNYS